MQALIFAAQFIDLLCCIAWHSLAALIALPLFVLRCALAPTPTPKPTTKPADDAGVVFYEGVVTHARRAPVLNSFRNPVRVAVVSLDAPPRWFAGQATDHFSADEARTYAGTKGAVRLLTSPTTAGYTQNPISVYYCYGEGGVLERAIAEVTNTPWNERVRFVFDPAGAVVKKALHVSPFMDMEGTWHLEAQPPGDTLRLVVNVSHPTHGPRFFHADLSAVRSNLPSTPSECGTLGMLATYGFGPHRVAVWIYWQAVVLLCKGLPVYGLPSQAQKERAATGATHPYDSGATGAFFTWRPAPRWPWNAVVDDASGGLQMKPLPGKEAGGGGSDAAARCPASGAVAGAGGGGCPFASCKQA
ncbi:hypothetical protein FOA52_006371 [Chlamydomonas sp. UWO 241]|nr:hypothetical protein FOA52_006371 [Chlamydomonas sp. UWO 241]